MMTHIYKNKSLLLK